MKHYLFLIQILIISTMLNAAPRQTATILQKVILIPPAVRIEKTVEEMVIREYLQVLKELDGMQEIVYLDESVWQNYKELISRENNPEQRYLLLVQSGISGLIFLDLFYGRNSYTLRINMNNLVDGRHAVEEFYLPENYSIDDIVDLRDYLKSQTLVYFSRMNKTIFNDSLLKARNFLRKNPDYELGIGGGLGYFYREPFGSDIQSHGLNAYLRIEGKWDYLSLNAYFESAFFWDYPDQPDKTPLSHFFGSLDLGGWILGELFRFGGGFGFIHGYFFYENKIFFKNSNGSDSWNYSLEMESITEALLFSSFYFKPSNRLIVGLIIGGFINLNNVTQNRHNDGPPFYSAFIFRYMITDQFYIEFSLPNFSYSKSVGNNENRSSMQTNINLGIGWNFIWRVK